MKTNESENPQNSDPQLPTPTPTIASPEEWRQRAAFLKEAEWAISRDLLQLGRSLLASHDPEEGPGAALRILEGGSKFGRLATNMEKWDAADTAPVTAPAHEWQKDFAASVDRVYGRLARKEKLP